ncbi:MAG TPA: hypothetical protein VLX59_13995 [Acidimicrobiales bacterium]|nr:hypothetical protein [Acidimicrobiales bacterium]
MRADPRALREDILTDSPWRWSGSSVVCRWCRGVWNHRDDCDWVAGRESASERVGT